MGKKTGRPSKDKSKRRDRLIQLRVTPDELSAIDAAAKADGKNRSDWARKALLTAPGVLQ